MTKNPHFWAERFVASAGAGRWLGGLRRPVRFAAQPVGQGGVLLPTLREPSFAFWFVPLMILSFVGGAVLAAFG